MLMRLTEKTYRFDPHYPSLEHFKKAHNDQRFWGLFNETTGECYLHPGSVKDEDPLFVSAHERKEDVTYGAKNDKYYVVFSGKDHTGLGNIIPPSSPSDGGGHKIFLENIRSKKSVDNAVWRGFSIVKREKNIDITFRSHLNNNDENNREMQEPVRSQLQCFLETSLCHIKMSIPSPTKTSTHSHRFYRPKASAVLLIAGIGIAAVTSVYCLRKK